MTIIIGNSYIGYLETETSINNYTDGVSTLHNLIKTDFSWILEEYKKSKFEVMIRYDNDDVKTLYSISVSKINKLIKLGIL